MNLVAELVRKKPVLEALDILQFTPKKAAKSLYKVIQSAGKNAENNFQQDYGTLVIKEIIVNEGPTYKRWQPVSRGRSHPILKRSSHVTVKVEATAAPKKKAAPKKAEAPKKEEAKTEEPKETSKKS